jgi:hypothetical protein
MKNVINLIILAIFITSCSQINMNSENWPEKLTSLETGIVVQHSADTVYATINKKDPEKRGKYQLKFTTTVYATKEDLKIIEFGGYTWKDNQWVFSSIYDRPFNTDEFEKWYGAKDGKLILGEKISDTDNWLAKTNELTGQTFKGLWYFIGENTNHEKFIGVKEIVGVLNTGKINLMRFLKKIFQTEQANNLSST